MFYLYMKDYINLIRSAGFRPGIEPLRIKNFQCQFVLNRLTNQKDILSITLFNTKTKPKHRLFCHPFFTKNIYPEIVKRNQNSSPEDYFLFPNFIENRRKIYQKISKTFTRLSKELNLKILVNSYVSNRSYLLMAMEEYLISEIVHIGNPDKNLTSVFKKLYQY